MSKEKKIIYVLTGIILGILLSVALIGNGVLAKTNVQKAAGRLIERYPETGILPSVGLAIFLGESGGGHNEGRYYGIAPSRRYPRIWDVVESTDQFLLLMRRYKNVDDQKTWIGQLRALQRHGYYEGSSKHYISYISGFIKHRGLEKYDRKAKRYKKELKKKKCEEKRKRRQRQRMILIYDPTLAPWQVRTYRGVIKGGTIRLHTESAWNYTWLDVVSTKKGAKNVIYTGNRAEAMLHPQTRLEEVLEEAVG